MLNHIGVSLAGTQVNDRFVADQIKVRKFEEFLLG